eukprot:2740743-Lingulodinium_polyedra.AAC.1
MRSERFRAGSVRSHAHFDASKQVVALLKARSLAAMILEEVPGFGMRDYVSSGGPIFLGAFLMELQTLSEYSAFAI